MGKALSPDARRLAIAVFVGTGFEAGTSLPEIRKGLAKKLGGSPSLYLGTADPVYYRLLGLSTPLVDGKGKRLSDKATPAVLRSAVRRRRDSGVRWNVLAASIEATTGRRTSESEAKSLYAKAGGDLDSSYTGRGTRVGAPTTYADEAAAAEVAAK